MQQQRVVKQIPRFMEMDPTVTPHRFQPVYQLMEQGTPEKTTLKESHKPEVYHQPLKKTLPPVTERAQSLLVKRRQELPQLTELQLQVLRV